MHVLLILAFWLTALLYASVGFGGGSTYSALLVLSNINYQILPAISLSCNIIVVAGGVFHFAKQGDLPAKAMIPFMVTSVPFAWIGGRLAISETVFVALLGTALLFAGLRLITQSADPRATEAPKRAPLYISYGVGAGIGFLSGMVGIGGGIFLAPILYFLNWDRPRRIAAACSLFILVNSIAGLAGQIAKLEDAEQIWPVVEYWPLVLSVFIGGQLGSLAASKSLRPDLIKRLTAILILFVAARLLVKWIQMLGIQ